ncbi:MAG: sulfur oxidation c-type cytochrome SoxA [Pseudomonadota bacterium]
MSEKALTNRRIFKSCFLSLLLWITGCTSQETLLSPTLEVADDQLISHLTLPIVSGKHFQSKDTQSLQADDFANPGMLWVDKGLQLWETPPSTLSPSCAKCHSNNLQFKTVATRYPVYSSSKKRVINLEQRINQCREQQQMQPTWAYESQELLSITAYIANLSRGMPFSVTVNTQSLPFLLQGQDYYYTRRGQLNLACFHCHENYVGTQLRGDKLSQGHGNGYPAYRLEWQTLGSLHRRLRACDIGVRAEAYSLGSTEYVNLELYLAWRAQNLTIETPAVRR